MPLLNYDIAARFRKAWGADVDWNNFSTANEDERKERVERQADMADAFYDMVTENYRGGWGDSFHFTDYMPGDTWAQAQARHEHFLAVALSLRPGMRVLDAGCGVGGPAREIAQLSGAHVTGVTINAGQVKMAQEANAAAGLTDRVDVVQGDFSNLHMFPDGHFDAVYAIEALCHSADWSKTYRELRRVTKVGGRLAFWEEVLTPLYDESNSEHREIRGRIEYGASLVRLLTSAQVRDALKEAGWVLEWDEDRDLDPVTGRDRIPWWYALGGDMSQGIGSFWHEGLLTFGLKESTYNVVWYLEWLMNKAGLRHPARLLALQTVATSVYAYRDGGKIGIVTPLHIFVSRNPGAEDGKQTKEGTKLV
ncbi:unnamed protein product [Discula destructiva]